MEKIKNLLKSGWIEEYFGNSCSSQTIIYEIKLILKSNFDEEKIVQHLMEGQKEWESVIIPDFQVPTEEQDIILDNIINKTIENILNTLN
jgi:hypothetical protein